MLNLLLGHGIKQVPAHASIHRRKTPYLRLLIYGRSSSRHRNRLPACDTTTLAGNRSW